MTPFLNLDLKPHPPLKLVNTKFHLERWIQIYRDKLDQLDQEHKENEQALKDFYRPYDTLQSAPESDTPLPVLASFAK